MRASGIPAQYALGTLPVDLAAGLIGTMFPDTYQAIGIIPPEDDPADPAKDPTLLAETQAHAWFPIRCWGQV